jgi:hypothetical protein
MPRLAALVVVGAAVSIVPATAGASAAPAGPAPPFTIIGELNAVTAVSARDAWAVGNTNSLRTMILHWNGTGWKRVASPTIGGNAVLLTGVAATSASNAWAAGITGTTRGGPFILHWNGASWRRAPTPVRSGAVQAVAATSSSNAWAVGATISRTLILHWNGTSWHRVPSPVRHGALLAVAASGRSAWAVGFVGNAGFPGSRATNHPLILHWNGAAWRRVPTHLPPGLGNLRGVTVTPSGRAWAVGCTGCRSAGRGTPLIENWNGTSWRKVTAPGRASLAGLWAVTATSADNAWASGVPAGGAGHTTGIVHWDGHSWQTVPSPDPGGHAAVTGVAATSAGNAWAVGAIMATSPLKSVILHWNGTSWR